MWDSLNRINAKVDKIQASLNRIEQSLNRIEQREIIIMSDITDALDKLEAQTAAISGAEESAEHAFTELAALIASLKQTTTDPATIARIDAVSQALAAKAASLGAAVEAAPKS